jgi:hypothetical protein
MPGKRCQVRACQRAKPYCVVEGAFMAEGADAAAPESIPSMMDTPGCERRTLGRCAIDTSLSTP